ncbi:docking protein 2 isoform X2 [Poecile atricapillus]|uniref:docking protein 2 isoform X2 n=1 Tax=Poecile atricapillus TaxID=48891 RepID=UPI002738CF36|nr:docking protein 2 isoform X2 [Poecile atricapillus]
MEEAVVKQGWIYLQLQQPFGKRWKKLWAVLYRDSRGSPAHLELRDGPERPRKAEPARRPLRLRDCVRVVPAGTETACPGDTVPILLDTAERRVLLAAPAAEAHEWIRRMCELAFPRSQEEPGVAKEGSLSSPGTEREFSMEENSLYSSRDKACLEQEFEVTVRPTPSSQRCQLRGRCILRAAEESLELRHPRSREPLFRWPYRFLRRFGRDKVSSAQGARPGLAWAPRGPSPALPPQVTFSFEAGRRCESGEGNFEFDTRQGNEIFAAIEAAIELQRGHGAEEPRRGGLADEGLERAGRAQGREEHQGPSGEAKGLKAKAAMPPGAGECSGPLQPSRGADFPQAEPRRSPRPRPGGAELEPEYAVPFDAVAKALLARRFGGLGRPREGFPELPRVPRDAGGGGQPPGRPPAPKAEHIYDEPEGLAALALYDEPEEPPGLGCPYNPQSDDYAVPKRSFLLPGSERLGHCDYDNVALRGARRRNLQ